MVTLLDIKAAQQLIKGVAARTFLIRCGSDDSFFLKPESLQPIGAFKIRGAYNKIGVPDRCGAQKGRDCTPPAATMRRASPMPRALWASKPP